MKNKPLVIVIALVILSLLAAYYFYFKKPANQTPTTMSESAAVEILKTKFPELKNYPSSNFPVKSIKTEQAADGWYVAFIQEGSGVPIVNAQCFLIKNNEDVEEIIYISDDVISPGEFSIKECRVIKNVVGGDKDEHGCIGSAGYTWCQEKQKCLRIWEEVCEGATGNSACKLENCHGLDIKCGPNPPDYCTMMYGLGDKCLQYAKCGIENNKCQQIENPQFTQCKSCVEACIENNKDDTIKSFECESKCN